MYKMKALFGLAVTIGALAITAAPSLAWFKSLSGKSENQAKLVTAIVFEGGGGTIECPVTGSEIHYKILKKNGRSISKQKAATEGPDQLVRMAKWSTGCKAQIGAIETSAEFKPCEIHLQQQTKGQNTATASIFTECVLKFSVCEIKIPAANESTGENFNLLGTNLIQKGKNVFVEFKAEGITGIGNGGLCPFVNNKTSKFKFGIEELEEELI